MLKKKKYFRPETVQRNRDFLEDAIEYYFISICMFASEPSAFNKTEIGFRKKEMYEAIEKYRFCFVRESQKDVTKKINELKERIKKEVFEACGN